MQKWQNITVTSMHIHDKTCKRKHSAITSIYISRFMSRSNHILASDVITKMLTEPPLTWLQLQVHLKLVGLRVVPDVTFLAILMLVGE